MDNLKDKNLYYVGGVVRDEVLGTKSFDTDFCYEGNAIDFARYKGFNIVQENPDFGTVKIIFDDKKIDIASTRKEIYPDAGHLPTVYEIGCSLEEDLKRRDFTINSIAKNTLTNEIFDPFNGISDIKHRVIKVLHNKSFIDDPTRILRGLKFSVRFGFKLDKETKILQNEYLHNINYDMSYHRLKKELEETFNLNSAEAFDKFKEQNIYKLLGENQEAPNIEGIKIKTAIENLSDKMNIWLIYMSFFNLSNLPLTRREQSILNWADKLKSQSATNNTPYESIFIYNLRRETNC
ncbi:MAG: hypothetical protein MJ230_05615 [bacterium]|nr:hypothetical protein [bacterium]